METGRKRKTETEERRETERKKYVIQSKAATSHDPNYLLKVTSPKFRI